MTGYKTTITTPYYRQVVNKLHMLGTKRGMIDQREFARILGVKVTKSFRRAMTQAEIDGLVTKVMYLTEKNGRAIGYELHTQLRQLPLVAAGEGQPF